MTRRSRPRGPDRFLPSFGDLTDVAAERHDEWLATEGAPDDHDANVHVLNDDDAETERRRVLMERAS